MYLKGRPITMYMPKELLDTYCLEEKADLPPKKLKLDWVYPFVFLPVCNVNKYSKILLISWF